MTSPLLPERPDPSKKRLAVFVHGFDSDKGCWTGPGKPGFIGRALARFREPWVPLLTLLKADPKIADAFDIACFEYPTRMLNFRMFQRIPRLQEIILGLNDFLRSPELRDYREVVLVGHSQGGLVILGSLYENLIHNKAEDLERIRSVILIATPVLGSDLMPLTRRFLSIFFPNEQEKSLRAFDAGIADIRTRVGDDIVSAGPGGEGGSFPIPVQCFWGKMDRVVLESSARGPFDARAAKSFDGDHSSILRPRDDKDKRYTELAEALLEPWGHKSVFEVENYTIAVSVAPVPEDVPREVEDVERGRTVQVRTDNVATLHREMKFSRKNLCDSLYMFRYTTGKPEGYVAQLFSHRNEAMAEDLVAGENSGKSVVFGFRPKPGESYWQTLKIYKGYDKGERNLHFHLGKNGQKFYYRRFRLSLDLTAYREAGWSISEPPKLRFFKEDEGHSRLCAQRAGGAPIAPLPVERDGLWTWELENLRRGVVDVIWDVAEPARTAAPALAGA